MVLFLAGALHAQEPAKAPTSLTVAEIMDMVKSGVTDDVIIAAVKSKGKPFDLNGAEITELTKSGVSQAVIGYMLDPNKPYAPPAAPPPSVGTPPPPPVAKPPEPVKPTDPLVAKLPAPPGLYYLTSKQDSRRSTCGRWFRPNKAVSPPSCSDCLKVISSDRW
jgi:hypothetical protein